MRRGLMVIGALVAAAPAAAQAPRHLTNRGLDSLRRDVAIDSVDAESYYRLGMGLWEKKQFDAADSAFLRAVHFQPWHAGAHLALSILPVTRGERYLFDLVRRVTEDSVVAMMKALRRHEVLAMSFDPRLDLAPLAFLKDDQLIPDYSTVQFGSFSFRTYSTEAVRPMRRALRALIDRRPDTAFAILAEVLSKRRPNETMSDRFISLYAMAAIRSRHPDAAANGYRELAQREGRREAALHVRGAMEGRPSGGRGFDLLLYGMASAEAGQEAVARAAFREALTVDLTFYQAHARLADLAEGDGDLEEALTERRAAIAIAPEEGRPYLDLGVTLLQAGRAAEARDALLDAAQRLPWDPGTQLFLFDAAMQCHDRATAGRALAALDLFAPRRNHEQLADAHRRFDDVAAQ